ncbi:MAG: GNAT family N-acetyltransferase [Gemmatimonadales bacterium]|nr:GNAT family N-acetyltransferase [Gemmatimonadales bacterium]
MERWIERTDLATIADFRNEYQQDMACQVIHDSLHSRPGWTVEYAMRLGDTTVGYGSIAIAGPWADSPVAYEFYLTAPARVYAFEFFEALLGASGVRSIEMQSNDALGTAMLFAFADSVRSESILFEDGLTTNWRPNGAVFRHPTVEEEPALTSETRRWRGVIESDGVVAATGGVLFHYNPPYGDVYMDVEEEYRRRGFGSFMVQELKRLCREDGRIPGARCNIANIASRHTLQKAGFVPCGHLLRGERLDSRGERGAP